MQGKQPTTSQDIERKFFKKRRLNFEPKLCPNRRARLERKFGAICQHELRIAPKLQKLAPAFRKMFSLETDSRINLESKPKNSSAQRKKKRFYAKRCPKRMKWQPIERKMNSSMCICVLRRAGAIYSRFRSLFRRSKLPTVAIGIYS